MRISFSPKLLAISIALSGSLLCSAAQQSIVKMWQSPMPKKDVKGAGYPTIPGIVHSPIFRANEATGGYGHHAKIFKWNKRFYAMWSNQRYAEDGPGQRILFATSTNGRNWSKPRELFPAIYPEAPWGYSGINLSANKWVVWKGRLFGRAWCGATVAWENRAKTEQKKKHDRKHCFAVRKVYNHLYREVKADGSLGKIFTFKPEKLPKDTLYKPLAANKVCPGFKPPHSPYKFRSATRQSKRRLCEPAAYQAKDGSYVALFRDDTYSHRKFVSFSKDGKNWSTPAPTNIPDSPSATTALTLKNGTVLLIGNHMAPEFDKDKPRHYGRDPLMLSISKDGKTFDKTYAIRCGKQKYTIPRKAVRGRGGGAQYPAVLLDGDTLYVMYSMGKEDIWVSSFPLSAVGISKGAVK